MTLPGSPDVNEIWTRFHGVINLTARELNDWLCAGITCRQPTDVPLGGAVLAVLDKRKSELTEDDLTVMRTVLEAVEREANGITDYELATDDHRRHRLLDIGHDPLRAFLSRSRAAEVIDTAGGPSMHHGPVTG